MAARILSPAKPDTDSDGLSDRSEIEEHGTWNILQIALLMVIMGASLFVLHEQNHLMDSFDFIVMAVIAFGTFLLRFSSMWGALGGSSNSVK